MGSNRTGLTMPFYLMLRMAFDASYEAGAEDAGSGELLVEMQALQCRSTTDGKTRRVIAGGRDGDVGHVPGAIV